MKSRTHITLSRLLAQETFQFGGEFLGRQDLFVGYLLTVGPYFEPFQGAALGAPVQPLNGLTTVGTDSFHLAETKKPLFGAEEALAYV